MENKRELWIDNTKLLACVLVVLGHFFQSMVTGILPETQLYNWFNKTIYYFHVPLFFICSGYLYQKTSAVNSFSAWRSNIAKKGITLGVPYFAFSLITWVLKEVFSGSVNNPNNGLFETLFLSPSSPYWYLYVLFFLFAITSTFTNKKSAFAGFLIAVALKLWAIFFGETSIYIISKVCENEIWFVLGMVLSVFDFRRMFESKKWKYWGCFLLMFFVLGSVLISGINMNSGMISFLMGVLGCMAVILVMINCSNSKKQNKVVRFLSKYTMEIFLMHTIFAAGFRSVLLKFGITQPIVHVVLGITASFAGPIIAAEILKRLKLDFLVYPGKHLDFRKGEGKQHV